MSNDTRRATRPSHRVYSVSRSGDDTKGKWTEIGAAWPHKDGQGFNLKLSAMPAAGAEVVLRVPSAKKGGAQ